MTQKEQKLAILAERVLIFLDGFPSFSNEIDGPFDLTQFGIAAAVDAARSNVPRSINPLVGSKLVEKRKVHIPGVRQKRYIYYLTAAGRLEARDVRRRLLKTNIRVVDTEGKESVETPEGIRQRFLNEFEIEEILFSIPAEGPLDCRQFLRESARRGVLTGKQVRKDADGSHFHGREREMNRIRRWLRSDKTNTLIIKGIPGIGKSTLLANVMDDIAANHETHFFNINPWCSLRSLIQLMADSFARAGSPELKAYLREQPDMELYDIEFLLASIFPGRRMMLIFDNLHNANKELNLFFSMLRDVVGGAKGVKLVMLGRHVEPFYDRAAVAVDRTVLEIMLEGLDEPGSLSLARSFDIPEERIDAIVAQAGGHPLFIELLVHGEKTNGNMDMERFIAEEFVGTLKKEENELLRYLSVFRYPVERSALRSHQPALFGLLKKSLLKQSEDDYVILHDILKDAFYRQLSDAELRRFHSRAAEHYIESLQIPGHIEAVHHLLHAGRADSAMELMLLKAEKMLKGGNMESLARVLTILLSRDVRITPGERALLLHAQGTALAFLGEVDSALENFNRSMELVADPDEPLRARNRMGIAEIMLNQNKYEDSEAVFREMLEWARKNKDSEMEAEVNYQLGSICERFGVPEQALRYFKSAWEFSVKMNDKKQLAQALWGIGRIYHVAHKFEKAMNSKNEALDIALKSGNEHLASKILTSIGRTLSEMGCLNEEIEAHEKAIELSRKSGAVRVLAYALSNAGAAYIDKPNLVQASVYLEEALALLEKIGERRMIATVKLNMASIMVLRGKHSEGREAFREAKLILEALNGRDDLMISYFKFGQAMRKVERHAEAIRLLKKALQISGEIGDSDASEQITREMQDLSEEMSWASD